MAETVEKNKMMRVIMLIGRVVPRMKMNLINRWIPRAKKKLLRKIRTISNKIKILRKIQKQSLIKQLKLRTISMKTEKMRLTVRIMMGMRTPMKRIL